MKAMIAMTGAALLLTGCSPPIAADTPHAPSVAVSSASAPAGATRLESAAQGCNLKVGGTANLGDGGLTLVLGAPMLWTMQSCILTALDVPDAVLAHMRATRALDGMQSDSWGTVKATWTYHPDDGLDLILTSTD